MKRKYTDDITDFTEPFWDNQCPKCKKRFWSVSLDCVCPKCGNQELYILNESKHLKHDEKELEKYKSGEKKNDRNHIKKFLSFFSLDNKEACLPECRQFFV